MTQTADVNGRRVNLGTRIKFNRPLMRAMQMGTYIRLPKPNGVTVDKRAQSRAAIVAPADTDTNAKGI